MKEELTRYIDLLFAGAPDVADIKQEILQNTLDRYDDLIAQGRTPQAAYQLAIIGIGDISELLGADIQPSPSPAASSQIIENADNYPGWKKAFRAIAVSLYILCPIPLFILQNEVGLCGLLAFVAVATALMIIAGSKKEPETDVEQTSAPPETALRNAVKTIIWVVGLCAYFAVSFSTGAWYITWLIFPITAAVQGLVLACIDLKEA